MEVQRRGEDAASDDGRQRREEDQCERDAHSELDVDVTKTTLSASSDRLKLALYLPQPVHADRGSAKWDDKKKVLTIELPVDVDEW